MPLEGVRELYILQDENAAEEIGSRAESGQSAPAGCRVKKVGGPR